MKSAIEKKNNNNNNRFKKQHKIQKGWIFSICLTTLLMNKSNPERKKNDFKDIRERNRILKREKTR
ncbi:hypothetical protein Hanom_Chr12g01069601 [Helianthus anomalus]